MNLTLRTISEREEAETLLPELQVGIRETGSAYHELAADPGAARAFLDERFERPETILVVGEAEDRRLALAATGPFQDPLGGPATPLLVVLWVDPSIRHRGVARALVAEVQERLRERGFPVLLARAGHNDDALISMGERWGWVRTWEMMSPEE